METIISALKEKISSLVIYDEIESDTIKFARAAMCLNENLKSIVLSIGIIKKIIKNNEIKANYLDLIALLTHPDIDFLQLEYVLLIDDDDDPIEISNDAMVDAYETGYLQNPKNPDHIIYDYDNYVFPTFIITESYIEQSNWRHEC